MKDYYELVILIILNLVCTMKGKFEFTTYTYSNISSLPVALDLPLQI